MSSASFPATNINSLGGNRRTMVWIGRRHTTDVPWSHGNRACGLVVLLVLTAGAFTPMAAADRPRVSERQVKAADLLHFARFVEWPSAAFAQPDSPIVLGVIADSGFTDTITETLRGKTVGRRSLVVRRVSSGEDPAGCQMLFVASAEQDRLPRLLRQVAAGGVLVIGESEGFAVRGGVIQFILDESHVRFIVNPDAASRAGLRLSAQLLSLARIVRDGKGAEQ